MFSKASARQLFIILAPSVLVLVVISIICFIYEIEVVKFTRDPLALFDKHPLYGFLSNLGVLLWSATAAICFFSVYLLREQHSKKIVGFLFSSALLSLYLLFDDLFQLHEYFFYKFFSIDEKIVYCMLALVILIYLIYYRKLFLKTNLLLLLLAIGFLGFSVIIDGVLAPWLSWLDHWIFIFEDGGKWLGIVCWCSYFVDTSYHALKNNLNL